MKETDDPFEKGIQGYDDPAEFMGFDIAAIYPLLLAGLAYSGLPGDYTNLVAAGAIGSGSYYVGSVVKKWGYDAKSTELTAAATAEANNTASG